MRLKLPYNLLLPQLFSLLIILVPVLAATAEQFPGQINSDNINLRQDSTVSSQTLSLLRKGEKVEVVSESYGWYKIRLPKSAPSYVKKDFFECINYKIIDTGSPVPSQIKECTSAKAINDNVNVRLKPSESSAVLGKINKNEVVRVLEEKAGWLRIEPIQNSFGWVNKKFIDTIPVNKK